MVDVLCFLLALMINLSYHAQYVSLQALIEQNRMVLILYLAISALLLLSFKCYDEPLRDMTLFGGVKMGGVILLSNVLFNLLISAIGIRMPFLFMLNLFIYSVAISGIYRLLVVSYFYVYGNVFKIRKSAGLRRVIIFGAGHAGKYLVDVLKDPSKGMLPVAFMDDDPRLEGKRIKGLTVVGPRMLIPYAAKKYDAEVILIAIPFVDNSTIREIFNLCCEAGCTVKRFGNMSNLAFEGLSKSTINEVRVEDLLQREVVRLDLESVSALIKGKVVMVTGGAGSIGSELCRQILHYGAQQLIIFDFNENGLFEISMELKQKYPQGIFAVCIGSIRDRDMLDTVFGKHKPQIVFHAAAYKHVPMMELNFREALENNILGTKNVVDAAVKHNVERFILISTDKAVNPSNIMGATKRVAELIIQRKNKEADTLFTAVRFGNVLGSMGSVVPLFKKQIQEGGPLTVTHKEITRYFMTIPEAVQLVLEAASITRGGEVFVLDMGQPVNIYDLATTMIKLSGLTPEKDIKIEVTGLRPGEKLYEELSLTEEKVIKTSNNKIFMIKSNYKPDEVIEDAIDKLCGYTVDKDYDRAYEQVRMLVPSFKNGVLH
jgi:FlaA1/EpsC-like NDP-sugar epimerase